MKNLNYIISLFVLFMLATACKESNEHRHTVQTHDEHSHDDHNHDREKDDDAHPDDEHDHVVISQAQLDANNMQLGTLTKKTFPEVVKATGVIDVPPQNKQIVTSFNGGNIRRTTLLIGDKVRKGQPLVTIENPDFVSMQQEYAEVKENLEYLKNEYEKQKTLFKEQISSQKKYLLAKSKYYSELAKYNGLKQKLKMLNIRIANVEKGRFTPTITLYSKINGFVTKVNVNTGSYVNPNDVIMEIVSTDHLHVELTVFEKDAMKIKQGQQILFKVPESSDEIFEAEVHLVGTSIDEENRTIKVHGHLDENVKYNFATGMYVEGDIITKSREEYALPEEAVVEDDHSFKILVLKEKKGNDLVFEPVEVSTGPSYDGFVAIISDKITPKDTILIKGAFDIIGEAESGHTH